MSTPPSHAVVLSCLLDALPRGLRWALFLPVVLIRVAPVVSAMMTPYQRARLPSLVVALTATIGAHALGGGVGLYLIKRFAARTNDHLIS